MSHNSANDRRFWCSDRMCGATDCGRCNPGNVMSDDVEFEDAELDDEDDVRIDRAIDRMIGVSLGGNQ